MPGSVLFPLLVVSTLFNSKAMILPPKSCKSQGLSLFSFFHICNVSAFVRGGREGTAGLGAFCCALKEDLSLKDFWNKVCRAKARLAQELALTSSKPPHSQCTDLLFFAVSGPDLQAQPVLPVQGFITPLPSPPQHMGQDAACSIPLLTAPPGQFSVKRKQISLRRMV